MARNISNSQVLHRRARDVIIDRIRQGAYRAGEPLPTFQELASDLKVSTSVAFIAVKAMCEEGWLTQGDKRRHFVSANAKRLVVQQYNTNIAFSSRGIDHILQSPYQCIFHHLIRRAQKYNIHIDCVLELDETSRFRASETSYDAIITTDWHFNKAKPNDQTPVIGLDLWDNRPADYIIMTDNYSGGEMIGRYLYTKGYRKVVYWDSVTGLGERLRCLLQRRVGFLKGWIESGGHFNEIKIMDSTCKSQAIRPLLMQNLDADVFFVSSDEYAMKIWDILKEAGVRVPEQIALAGFDGIYESLTHEPPLTTIKQPYEQLAAKIMDVLVSILSKTEVSQKKWVIEPILSVGGSA